MLQRRILMGLAVSATMVVVARKAFAKGPHRHHDGHALLGAKLKQNGKHEVAKAGKEIVMAEVNNGKVTAMSAGSLPVSKVKTTKKMASVPPNVHRVAAGDMRLAQVEWYYGFCIDSLDYIDCYWYPASDVVITDGWVEYFPA